MMGEQPLLVWKFGGTSLADLTRLRAVAQRMVAAHRAGYGLVTVLSAMGSSTDELNAMAYAMSMRPQLRELDALLSVGENMSCALAAIAVQDAGEQAISLTGPQAGILTDGCHGNAQLWDVRPQRILEELDAGAIVLVTGYQGISPEGNVTTLGRGGSDASAVAMAAALGLHECEIFTDVPAVFSADPRVVPDARRLAAISRDEMLQLAAAGAAVLQPRAVELAAAHDIDIHVRSSFTTEPGTWLQEETVFESFEITGVAHRERETFYTVRDVSSAAITAALAQRAVAIGSLIRNDRNMQFTAPGADEAEVVAALSLVGVDVTVGNEFGSVSVVGAGIARRPDLTARAILALEREGIDPKMTSCAPARICFHIPADTVYRAVRLLHDVFVLHGAETAAEAEPDLIGAVGGAWSDRSHPSPVDWTSGPQRIP
jgi:aspartate kinase